MTVYQYLWNYNLQERVLQMNEQTLIQLAAYEEDKLSQRIIRLVQIFCSWDKLVLFCREYKRSLPEREQKRCSLPCNFSARSLLQQFFMTEGVQRISEVNPVSDLFVSFWSRERQEKSDTPSKTFSVKVNHFRICTRLRVAIKVHY